METDSIPKQKKGASFDVRSSVLPDDRAEAISHYQASRKRLLNISLWGMYSREYKEMFVLTNSKGKKISGAAKIGDLVKIHLPGPRSFKGDGADWVRVDHIAEEKNELLDEIFTVITLRPCQNPTVRDADIAHFYNNRSTNTFLVCRHRTEIISSIHGRNELVNTDTDWLDYARNLMVALPAKAGLSNPHWKKLAEGLIR
jgi:hypothetical protein